MRLLWTLLLAMVLAAPAAADMFRDMSPEDREVLHGEFRRYLLDNPDVILEVIEILEARQEAERAAAEAAMVADNRDALLNDGVSYVSGEASGDITIVEFQDYQCGYCKRAHPELLELLRSDGNIRLIHKEYPVLGPMSQAAARAALVVLLDESEETYAAFSDRLLRFDGTLTRTAIISFAQSSGADKDNIFARSDDPDITAIIEANLDLGRRLQVTGTPTFVIGDRIVRGYLPVEQMRELVSEERAEM